MEEFYSPVECQVSQWWGCSGKLLEGRGSCNGWSTNIWVLGLKQLYLKLFGLHFWLEDLLEDVFSWRNLDIAQGQYSPIIHSVYLFWKWKPAETEWNMLPEDNGWERAITPHPVGLYLKQGAPVECYLRCCAIWACGIWEGRGHTHMWTAALKNLWSNCLWEWHTTCLMPSAEQKWEMQQNLPISSLLMSSNVHPGFNSL